MQYCGNVLVKHESYFLVCLAHTLSHFTHCTKTGFLLHHDTGCVTTFFAKLLFIVIHFPPYFPLSFDCITRKEKDIDKDNAYITLVIQQLLYSLDHQQFTKRVCWLYCRMWVLCNKNRILPVLCLTVESTALFRLNCVVLFSRVNVRLATEGDNHSPM
jgi:hypothetical protein